MLYDGNSEGFGLLTEGYLDYAHEVITNRAVPDLRDGLKPVQRRILYTMNQGKVYSQTKCVGITGAAVALHPHSDDSVYASLCRMVERSESYLVPLLEGDGSFGKVYSTDGPAASRYTTAMLGTAAKAFFRDMDGVDLVDAEVGEGYEPPYLPVTYPYVLVAGGSGMAVSVATSMPSFNIWDVLSITEKFIRGEDIKNELLHPDFPTGGVLVEDARELYKVMNTGRGKFKVRAKVEIENREIIVSEVPVGKTINWMVKKIQAAEIPGVQVVSDSTDFAYGARLVITCTNKNMVDSVLMELYRLSILQTSFSANMLTTCDGKPVIGGVKKIMTEWVKWRKKTLTKKIRSQLAGIDAELLRLSFFIQLISNPEWRDHYIDVLVHQSNQAAKGYLRELFPTIKEPEIQWISERRAVQFRDGGAYKKRYEDLLTLQETYKGNLADLSSVILQDLADVRKEYAGRYPRKTEISTTDYLFTKREDVVVEEDTSECFWYIGGDGFLTKTRGRMKIDGLEIEGHSSSRLVAFDRDGRILRVYGEDIPWTNFGEKGEYLPRYWGTDEWDIVYIGLVTGEELTLVYSDGYVGFLDTSEFLTGRKTKVLTSGVSPAVADKLVDVLNQSQVPEMLVVATYDGSDDLGDNDSGFRLGLANLTEVKRKSRTSRTKVFYPGKGVQTVDVKFWAGVTKGHSFLYFGGHETTHGTKVVRMNKNTSRVDLYELLNEGVFNTLPVVRETVDA